MKHKKNKALKKYLHDVKKDCHGNYKSKKLFIEQLKDSLTTYTEENTDYTYEDLQLTSGNPQELSTFYETPSKTATVKKAFRRAIAFSIIIASVFLIVHTAKYFYGKWDYSRGYDIEKGFSAGETDDNINPFTHETNPPAIKTYDFGTDYAK